MRSLILMLLVCVIVGCGEAEPKGKNVPLSDVPEPVMKVAKEKLPNVTFDQAWTTPSGNFEVRGKDKNGKVRDIQVKPNGEVAEVD